MRSEGRLKHRRTALVALLGALAVGHSGIVAAQQQQEPTRERAAASGQAAAGASLRTDGSALARAAAAAIGGDDSLVAPAALALRISSKGRAISLTGSAGTIYDREQAARRAEQVEGVSGIHPSISIKPPAGADASGLQRAVVEAVQQANVAGPDFTASATADGLVELSGSVTHEWTAVNAVKRVPGVTAIAAYEAREPGKIPPQASHDLKIVTPSPEQDRVILGRVQPALAQAGLDGIGVAVEGGIVKLTGRTAGLAAAQRASRVATMVPGVLGVKNELSVPGRAYRVGDLRDAGAVERDVRRKLRGSGGKVSGLNVIVSGSTVTLTGRASSEDTAYAMVEAAASIHGVHEVINALSYPSYTHGS